MIITLHTNAGSLTSHDDIAYELCSFYKFLFNGSSAYYINHDILSGPIISTSHFTMLGVEITDEEILAALKGIHENKSPRADDFNSIFFIKCWDVVGPTFLHAGIISSGISKCLTCLSTVLSL